MQTTFGYDDIDQLTSESRSGYSASYTYDANGDRLTRTIGSTTENYTYDDADKLDYIQINSVTVKDYSYDSAGRTTSVVAGSNTTSLTYDYENRVTQITYPNLSTNTFAYNGLDTRVSKVDSSGTRTYLRDGATVTSPLLNDGAANYTPSISERRSSTTTYYHNGIKNAESQTGTGQMVLATATFDAFGNVDTSSGTWTGPLSYGGAVGYQSDSDSGLMLLGHRYYDCSVGRFLSRDRSKDGRNWYVYCDSTPVQFFDNEGNQKATLHVSNKGIGHAWIELIYPDKRGRIVLENNMIGNVRVGDEPLDPKRKPDVSRTLPFDPRKSPMDLIKGLPDEYNLWTNNCITFVCEVWYKLTGEDFLPGRDTPGRLERDVRATNKKKPGIR